MGDALPLNQIVNEDALAFAKRLPDASVDCFLSSPAYYLLRNYQVDGQWGSEPTLDAYLANLWALFDEVYRVLKPTGTCFVNLGDTYMNDPGGQNGGAKNTLDYGKGNGRISAKIVEANRQAGRQQRAGVSDVRRKSLMLIPERFALGMVARGWILRNRICWTKPNAMPSSVRDRFACTWEYVFFFTKSERYWSDLNAVRVPHSSATIRRVMQASVHEQAGGEKQALFAENSVVTTRKPADIVKSLAAKYGNEPHRRGGLDGVEQGKPFCDRYFGSIGRTFVGNGQGVDERKALGTGGVAGADVRGRNPGDTWDIPTQPAPYAHFAVWPEDLARRIIRFGCPARVCAICGQPWVQPTTRTPRVKDGYDREKGHAKVPGAPPQQSGWFWEPPDVAAGEWEARCTCGTDHTHPGICWDAFMGSGTTALVALQEGRAFLGSELNPEYIAIAEKRIGKKTQWATRLGLPLAAAGTEDFAPAAQEVSDAAGD